MPPVTTTSDAVKPVTGSLKVKLKVTGALVVAAPVASVIARDGAEKVLNGCVTGAAAPLPLPVASVATPAGTFTVIEPTLLAAGVTTIE